MTLPTFQEILYQIKINLRLIGIPFNEDKLSIHFYFLFFNIILIISEETAFLILKVSSDNFLDLTQLMPCTCIGILSALKVLSIAFKKSKIIKLTKSLNQFYEEILKSPEKIQIIEKEVTFVTTLLKYFFVLNGILISVYNFATPVIIGYNYLKNHIITYSLPYAVVVPFSTDTWATWLLVYLHSIICGNICVLYFTTVDALYYILTSHICLNFAVLSNEIQNLDPKNPIKLNVIVKKHQNILLLAQELEKIFTLPNFFNVVVGSLEICMLGFNLTTGDWTTLPGVCLFLISVLLQILMMSDFGENLLRESKKVGESAYLCKWYEMDPKSKKIIFIIILRSNKPSQLTANKFSTICYKSFTKIISTSWSYFTLLRTLYTPPQNFQQE